MTISAKPAVRIEAAATDPGLSVHVLSQFAFCARAGICAYESPEEPEDETEPEVRLDFLPRYDLQELQQAFAAAVNWLLWTVPTAVAVFFLTAYLSNKVHPDVRYLGWVIEMGLLLILARFASNAWELHHRLHLLQNAKPQEPDPDKDRIQEVQWGELLQAGFMPIRYKERLIHEAWKLKGKPWRVLRRKNLRIPVFLRPEGDGKLHRKHFVKVAAYCHLLQATENAESPYGIVLTANSFQGVAIPNNPHSRRLFHEVLSLARTLLTETKVGKNPSEPTKLSLCGGCPFGEPKPYQPGKSEHESNGETLEVVALSSGGSTICHSHCGDRYQWVAPHELIERKKLRPT